MKKHILKALSLAAIFTLSFTNTWAQDPPEVVSLSPSNRATDVSLREDLEITFDQPIQFGFGETPRYVRIRRYDTDATIQSLIVAEEYIAPELSISEENS